MDDVTLQEVARTLGDMRQEFRTQLATLVRLDVYRAEQGAVTERVRRLEQDQERHDAERTADRRMVLGSFLAAGSTLLVALVMFVVTLSVHH